MKKLFIPISLMYLVNVSHAQELKLENITPTTKIEFKKYGKLPDKDLYDLIWLADIDGLEKLNVQRNYNTVIKSLESVTKKFNGYDLKELDDKKAREKISNIHNLLGIAYMGLKFTNEALRNFTTAYEINNDNKSAELNLAHVMYLTKDFEKAIELSQNYLNAGERSNRELALWINENAKKWIAYLKKVEQQKVQEKIATPPTTTIQSTTATQPTTTVEDYTTEILNLQE